MSKLRKQGASSTIKSVSKTDKDENKYKSKDKQRITTVEDNRHTTYKVTPITMRLSETDRDEFDDWVNELNKLTNKKASRAKLLRALTAMRHKFKGDDLDELVRLIKEM